MKEKKAEEERLKHEEEELQKRKLEEKQERKQRKKEKKRIVYDEKVGGGDSDYSDVTNEVNKEEIFEYNFFILFVDLSNEVLYYITH